MLRATLVCCIIAFTISSTPAAEPSTAVRLDAPADWKEERIELPPSFAPAMQLRGTEHLRFAPGMYRPESDSFLSYVFVLELTQSPPLDQATLERELLAYYRGLAITVLKNTSAPVDLATFTLTLKESPASNEDVKFRPNLTQFSGDLTWIEPFVTRQPQTLHMEVQMWKDVQNRNIVFACVSPQKPTAAIWKTMRAIRVASHAAE
jgi:hypothetical protein